MCILLSLHHFSLSLPPSFSLSLPPSSLPPSHIPHIPPCIHINPKDVEPWCKRTGSEYRKREGFKQTAAMLLLDRKRTNHISIV